MTHLPAILGCAGPVLLPDEAAFFRDVRPWGFILFSRNIDTAAQTLRLTEDLRDAVGYDAPILIDQEGGRVQRARPPVARDWLPPLEQVARAGDNAAASMYLRARIIAHELLSLGIDVNCIPTLDVAQEGTHPFLLNRCYGTDPRQVAAIGQAVAGGLMDGGVLPVIKHIPGHGRAQVDSHLHLPRVTEDRATLEATDFAPFQAMADLPLGMSAHVIYDAIDPRPGTISPVVIDLIRTQIGFDGLLMTDDISMEALEGTVAERSAAALAAGCDVTLHCNGDLAEMRDIAATLPPMTQEAQKRGRSALSQRATPAPVDIPGLEAKLAEMIGT
ncbi:glycoside hydrolase family 3 N-terminal domain-containing protein [Pseudaestuariivita atlantica]|uniref:beta-N-acetylhexosaminidase n=1 Tax=Pseudaestuariivita atlantica TaxID=1317121 RepID=A0A0L1JUN2_9RHOB|nr:glycoside hydrolase family 3 N-terminal domain-containing protein [Pseudaestuariivita atlantica]KNG95479.1 beta-hexosaminidase [Pseudaestuariivita atlantica]